MHESNEVDVYSTSSRARVVREEGRCMSVIAAQKKRKRKTRSKCVTWVVEGLAEQEQVCDVGC